MRTRLMGVALGLLLGIPAVASAQASAYLDAYWPYSCWSGLPSNSPTGTLYTTSWPEVTIKPRPGLSAQWVRVRWFLYKLDLQPFSTGTKVYTGKMSNWWYGIARSDWQQPQDWTEYAERADGTVYRTTTPAVHASMPGYGLSLPIKPLYSVRLYAWMQYEWLSASPTTKYPTQYAWAGGSCYWKFPWGSR